MTEDIREEMDLVADDIAAEGAFFEREAEEEMAAELAMDAAIADTEERFGQPVSP
jgi:hypothetical protein